VPLAGAETVPLPGGLDPSRAAALGISGVAAWTALAGTAALRPGESVLVLGGNGQVGRMAVQAARLLGARRVTAVVQDEAARQTPLQRGAGTVVSSQDLPTLTERLLETGQRGYDVSLDTLWGPVIPAAVGAAAPGARVVHLGNSAGALATLAGPAIRKNQVSILTYSIFTVPARERSDAFARLAAQAAAGELTVDYRETRLETLPAIWDGVAAGRAHTKIIVKPDQANPRMTAPAHTRSRQETTGPSPGFPPSVNQPIGRKKS
jgi:NADPH2:quinone reductase